MRAADGAIIGAHMVGLEVGERFRTQQMLRNREERLHVALASADLGTFVWHVREDRTEEDARARAHFGLPPNGTVSLAGALSSIFHPEDGARYAAAVARAIDPAGPGTLHEEYRIQHPNGEERWMATSAITTFEGTPPVAVRLTGALADITERKRGEANRALLAAIADDLNNLTEPDDIIRSVGMRMGEALNLNLCFFVNVDEERDEVTVHHSWERTGLPSLKQKFAISDFLTEEFARSQRAGETFIVRDTVADERTDAEAYAPLSVASILAVPFHREGRWVAYLAVTDASPRDWHPDEIEVVQQVAERVFPRIERARAEAALRESEEKYRTLFENMGQGYALGEIIRDEKGRAVDLRYLELNPAFERLSGIPVAQAQGRTVSEVYGKVEPEWFEVAERVARLKIPERVEYEIGAIGRWFQMHFYPAEGDRYLGLYEDVTDRKRAEAVLRESEERQAFLLTLSDALRAESGVEAVGNRATQMIAEKLRAGRVYLVTLDRGDDHVVVTQETRREDMPPLRGVYRGSRFPSAFNEISKHTIVYSDIRSDPRLGESERAAFAGLSAVSFIAAPIKRGTDTMIWAAGALSTEPRIWTPNEIALFEDAVERTWAAVERARAEAELRESEERFTQFAKASSAGIWIRDVATLAMEYVSPAIGTIYGIKPEAILGGVEKWAAMLVPEDRDTALAHIESARQGEPVTHEFRIQRPSDRTFRWIRNTDFPLDQNGHVRRIGGIAEDVTEQKLAAEHKGVLLAELQHRVRNIMAIIRSIVARTAGGADSVEHYADLLSGRFYRLHKQHQPVFSPAPLEPSLG